MVVDHAPSRLPFSKYHGLGNDFLVVDLREHLKEGDPGVLVAALQRRAVDLCARRFGVGGDGLLLLLPTSDDTKAQMIVINADGSRPEMCGNGLRCVAHHLAARDQRSTPSQLCVRTDNGPLTCEVQLKDQGEAMVRVAMGPARIGAVHHPKAAPERSFLDVNMGNPHAITWVGPSEDPKALAHTLGADIEVDKAYPQRSNVEFVLDTPDALVCWVWERGCGITLACGTGACATAAAAVHDGRRMANRPIPVRLPGGTLEITVPTLASDSISMLGPSRWVYDGNFVLEGL